MRSRSAFSAFTVLILFSVSISARGGDDNSMYVSFQLGAKSSNGTAESRFSGSPALSVGAGFGLPIAGNLSLFTRASYVSKSDYTGFTDPLYLDQKLESVQNIVTVNGSFSQLVLNGGLQYRVYLIDDLSLGAAGGLTYSLVNHESRLTSGEIFSRIDNTGVFGYFIALTAEKEFEENDLSIFAEGIYNNIRKDASYFRDVFSGVNFTVGMKYYFTNR